ncbi:chaperone NapD [Gynuella sunshinyii]|uniref:Chaperone NapD n=1 Tax=Gynuella sunshinyii YC6258 TaxID=1445510 RepID=A0A0C5V214_9GAMM|nr:chaperone NapD [Gynuella sunshinyii]AJQ93585.1 uncharacterized protein involved in formation of periplasmic nitrate reductase [Gynuella sunshinyii YC6258]
MKSAIHEEQIASLVVHCRPEQMSLCRQQIQCIRDTEIFHSTREGKMVVVSCAKTLKVLMDNVDRIRDIPEVINVALVYHQTGSQEEFDQQADVDQELETYFEQVQSGAFSDFGEFK